jgi:hypothetical protein
MRKRAPAITAILTMTVLLTAPAPASATPTCGVSPRFQRVITTATIAEVVVNRDCWPNRNCRRLPRLEVSYTSVHRTAVFLVTTPAPECRPDGDS